MSEVLPYDQWVESEEAMGLGELEKLKGYGEHYRLNSFASGNYNQEEATQVDQHLLGVAASRGLVDQEDSDLAVSQFMDTPTETTPGDVGRVLEHMELMDGHSPDSQNVRVHLLHLNSPDTRPDVLETSRERVAPFISPEKIRGAKKSAVSRGDSPVYAFENEDGTLDVGWDPSLEGVEMTDEQISEYAKADPAINSRYLPALRAAREKPEGFTVTRSTARQRHEFRAVAGTAEIEGAEEYRKAILREIKDKDYAAAEQVARDAAHHGIFNKNYSEETIVNGFMDWAKFVSGNDTPEILSTGEIAMPPSSMVNKDVFDAAVDALDVTEGQKKLTKKTRAEYLKMHTTNFHKLAVSFGGSRYVDLYEERKGQGKKDHEIIEEWFSDDENYSKARQWAQSGFFATLEAGGGAFAYPAALLGNEEAAGMMGSLMKHEMARNEYANLFGVKLTGRGSGISGFAYTLMRTAPAIATDIAISIPTGGTAGALSAGLRWSIKAGIKATFRNSLSKGTKAATKKALAAGGVSVSSAINKTGQDLSKYMSKVYRGMKGTAYASPAAFNRSAGATYVSMSDTLAELHPDWDSSQIREAAYGHAVQSGLWTVGIINTFGVLSAVAPKWFGAGVESWAAGSGTGLTVRQLNNAYKQFARNPAKIPPQMRSYIKLDSFEDFTASMYKSSVRSSVMSYVRHGYSEALEEGLDQTVNGFRDAFEIARQGGDDVDVFTIFHEAMTAAGTGAVFGLGGGVTEVGWMRAGGRVTERQQRTVEMDFYSRVADRMAEAGDRQSAQVLRGLVGVADARDTRVSSELAEMGAAATEQMAAIDEVNVKPLERIPRTPGELQRKFTKIEEYIQQLEEAGGDPGERSFETMHEIAGAKHYRERLAALHEEQLTLEASSDLIGPLSRGEVDPSETPLTHPETGDPMSPLVDRGTAATILDEKYDAKTEEEVKPILESLNSEISRLETYGAQASPYQAQRLQHLSEQRDALRSKFSPEPISRTPPKSPKFDLPQQLEQVERSLVALSKREDQDSALAFDPKHRARTHTLRAKRRMLRKVIAEGATKMGPGTPVTSTEYPIEKIIRLLNPATEGEEKGMVFNPDTGEVFDPRVDPKQAWAILQKAHHKKEVRDAATERKIQKGQKVSKAEMDSYTESSPLELFREDFQRINRLVALMDLRSMDASSDPELTKKLAALDAARLALLIKQEEDATRMVPASLTGEQSKRASENTKVPEPKERSRNFENKDTEGAPQILSVRSNTTAGEPVRNPFGALDDRLGPLLVENGAIDRGEQGPFVLIILNQRPTRGGEDFIAKENPSFDSFEQAEAAAEAIVASLGEVEGMSFSDTLVETDAESEEAAAISEGSLEAEEISPPAVQSDQEAARSQLMLGDEVPTGPITMRGRDAPAPAIEDIPDVPPPSLQRDTVEIGDEVELHHLDGSKVTAKLRGVSKAGTKKYVTKDGEEIIISGKTGEQVLGWAERPWSPHVENPRYGLRSAAGIKGAKQKQEVNTLTDEQLDALEERKAKLRESVKGQFGEGAHTTAEADLQAIRAEKKRRAQATAPESATGVAPAQLMRGDEVPTGPITMRGRDAPRSDSVTPANEIAEQAQKEVVAAQLEAIHSNRDPVAVVEEKIEEAKEETTPVVGRLLDTFWKVEEAHPGAEFTVVHRGGFLAVQTKQKNRTTFNKKNHTIDTDEDGNLVATSRKTGKPLKTQPIIEKLNDGLLYDKEGNIQFPAESDRVLFEELLESGAPPEPRSLLKGSAMGRRLFSGHTTYRNAFLGTLRAEVNKRWKPIPPPDEAISKTDPDPQLQEERVKLEYVVINRRGSSSAVYTHDDLVNRERELERKVAAFTYRAGTDEQAEQEAMDAAWEEVILAEDKLEEADLGVGYGSAETERFYTLSEIAESSRRLEQEGIKELRELQETNATVPRDEAGDPIILQLPTDEDGNPGIFSDTRDGKEEELQDWLDNTPIGRYPLDPATYGITDPKAQLFLVVSTEDGVATGRLEAAVPGPEGVGPRILIPPKKGPEFSEVLKKLHPEADILATERGYVDKEYDFIYRRVEDRLTKIAEKEAVKKAGEEARKRKLGKKDTEEHIATAVDMAIADDLEVREEVLDILYRDLPPLPAQHLGVTVFGEKPEHLSAEEGGGGTSAIVWDPDFVPFRVEVSDIEKMSPLETHSQAEFEVKADSIVDRLDSLRERADHVNEELAGMTRPGEAPGLLEAEDRAFRARDHWQKTSEEVSSGVYKYAKAVKELDMVQEAIVNRPAKSEVTISRTFEAGFRPFTTTKGEEVQARFVNRKGDTVTLAVEGGKTFKIRLGSLSESDRVYLEKWSEVGRQKGGLKKLEFDPERISSSKQKRLAQDFYKGHHRGVRAMAKKRKISRHGVTHNGTVPVVVRKKKGRDGVVRESEEAFFTNDPAITATQVHLGYRIKVPKEYLGEKGERDRNPAISVDSRGYVTGTFDPITQKMVNGPGGLLTYSGDEAFIPSEIKKGNKRADYIRSLPPVPYSHTIHLGSTVFGQEADVVPSMYQTETTGGDLLTPKERLEIAENSDDPEIRSAAEIKADYKEKTGEDLPSDEANKRAMAQIPEHTALQRTREGSPDAGWFAAAEDYFDGRGSGTERAHARSNVNRVERLARKEYKKTAGRLKTQINNLDKILEDEAFLAHPEIDEDILQRQGESAGLSLDTLKERENRVSLARLDSLIKAAEESAQSAEAKRKELADKVTEAEDIRKRKKDKLRGEIAEITEAISTEKDRLSDIETTPAYRQAEGDEGEFQGSVLEEEKRIRRLEHIRDEKISNHKDLDMPSTLEAQEEYRAKLLARVSLPESDITPPESIKRADEALEKARGNLDEVTSLREDHSFYRDKENQARSDLSRLTLIKGTVDTIREQLGEIEGPVNLEDARATLMTQLEEETGKFMGEVTAEEGEYFTNVEKRIKKGAVKRKDVEDLKEFIEKAGGMEDDARETALLLYKQSVREFGLAVQLSEQADPYTWLREQLDLDEKQKNLNPRTGRGGRRHSLDREAKEDFLKYLRSRYSVRQTPEIGMEEIEGALEQFASDLPLDKQKSKISLTTAQVNALKRAAETKVDAELAGRLGKTTEITGADMTRLLNLAEKASKVEGLHHGTRGSLEKLLEVGIRKQFLKNRSEVTQATRDIAKGKQKQRILAALEKKNPDGKLYSLKSLKTALSSLFSNDVELRSALTFLQEHLGSKYGAGGKAMEGAIIRNYVDRLLYDLDPTNGGISPWKRTRWSRSKGTTSTPALFKDIISELSKRYQNNVRDRARMEIKSIEGEAERSEGNEGSPDISNLYNEIEAALTRNFMHADATEENIVDAEGIAELQDAEFHTSIIDVMGRSPQAVEALRGVTREFLSGSYLSDPLSSTFAGRSVDLLEVREMWMLTHKAIMKDPQVFKQLKENAPHLARIVAKVYQSGARTVGLEMGNELFDVIDSGRTEWTSLIARALAKNGRVSPLRKFTEAKTGKRITATFVSSTDNSVRVRKEDGKEVTIPFSRLSEEDLEYIRSESNRRSTNRDLVSEGLSPAMTKGLLKYLVEEDTSLPPKEKQLLANTLKALESHVAPKVETDDRARIDAFPSIVFVTNPKASYAPWKGAYGTKSQTIYFNLTQRDSHKVGSLLRGLIVHAVNTVPEGTDAHKAIMKEGAAIRKALTQSVEGEPPVQQEIFLSTDIEPRPLDAELSPTSDAESAGVRAEQRAANRQALTFAMLNPEASDLMARRDPSFVDRIVDVLAKVLGLKGSIAKRRVRKYAIPERGSLFTNEIAMVPAEEMRVPGAAGDALEILESMAPPGHSIIYTPLYNNPAFTFSGAPNIIFVNPEMVMKMTNGLPARAKELVLQTLVDHELAHLASAAELTNADRASIIADISPADMIEVELRVPEGAGNIEIAEEYLRMKGEESVYGIDGDRFVSSVLNYGTGLRAQVLRHVERVLNKLVNRYSNRKRPSLKTAVFIQRIKERVDRIKRGGVPLQPVVSDNIHDYWEALHEMADGGTDRVFFSVPVWSSDDSHIENLEQIKKKGKFAMKRELNLIEKGIKHAGTSLDAENRDLVRKANRARKKGLVTPDTVNMALGSIDPMLTEEQQTVLRDARQADVDAARAGTDGGLTTEQETEIEEAHTKRIVGAERESQKLRTRQMEQAQLAVDRADPELGAAIKAVRKTMARNSRDVGGSKGGATKLLFDSRAETHLIRSYEFFHSSVFRAAIIAGKNTPELAGIDIEGLWDNALNAMVAHANARGKSFDRGKASLALNGWLRSLIEQPPDSLKPINVLSKSQDLFKDRQDIPKEIQELLGVRGNIDNATLTHTKLGVYLAKNEAAKDLRKLLISSKWVQEKPDYRAGVSHKLWSNYTGDEEYSELEGLYATPEDAEIIEEAMEQFLPLKGDQGMDTANAISEWTKKIAGASLMAKTVFSLGHFTRNEGSMSFIFRPLNGDFTSLLQVLPGTKWSGFKHAHLARQGLGLARIKEGDREYVSELVRRGMIKDGVTAGLLGDIFDSADPDVQIRRDLEDWSKGRPPAPWIKKVWKVKFSNLGTNVVFSKLGWRATPKFLTSINELIDSKAKVGLYEFEKDWLLKIRDEIGSTESDEEISKKAAAKVHATLPGHSQVYDPVRRFTNTTMGMMLAPFARFKSETVRTYLGTFRLITEEWAEANRIGSRILKQRAASRLVGFGGTQSVGGSLIVWAFSSIFNLLGGDDDEDRTNDFQKVQGEWGKAVKRGLPKWMRNHTVWLRDNANGSSTILDMTYFFPHSIIGDPGTVFLDTLKTDGFAEASWRLVETIGTDFIGEGIAPGVMRELLTNSDDYGRDIFLPTDEPHDRLAKFLAYYYQGALMPGFHSKTKQIMQALHLKDKALEGDRRFDARTIILGELLGARPQDYVTDEMMRKSARSVKRDLDSIKSILGVLNSGKYLAPGEAEEQVHKYVEAYKKLWGEHLQTAEAWAEHTGDPKDIEKYMGYMVEAGHSKSRTYGVMLEKTLDRFVRNRDGFENIFNAGQRGEGGEARVNEVLEAMMQYPEGGMDLRKKK